MKCEYDPDNCYCNLSELKDEANLNPGSHKAKAQGCTCPQLDNDFGQGGYKGSVVAIGCPLHAAVPPNKV